MKQRKIRGIKKRKMCQKVFLISKEENRGIGKKRGEKEESGVGG